MFGWGVSTVSVDELAEKLSAGKPVVIDVREPREFAAGHIKGSVNIPLGTLAAKAAKFDAGTDTYVICHSGNRSSSAVRVLQRAGFEHVYNVKGGT
ncbi:MAG TPA: rhodanese-like domain-containing protein, partial [Coriobacteriia bacterium]